MNTISKLTKVVVFACLLTTGFTSCTSNGNKAATQID